MRILIFSLSLVISVSGAKAENKQAGNASGSAAQFFYFENIPNNPQTIVFKLTKACEAQHTKPAAFSHQPFFSELQLPSSSEGKGKSKKKVKVRVLHLYGRYNRSCEKYVPEIHEEKFEIPRSKQMTHVYVTVDPDVEVQSIQ